MYFVTFHLGDSLPATKLQELRRLRDEWEQRHPPPRSSELAEQFARQTIEKVDRWLDQGFGTCLLAQRDCREILIETLHHFDDLGPDVQGTEVRASRPGNSEEDGLAGRPTRKIQPRYELGCYVIMPNHVHAVLRPFDAETHPLEEIIGTWKQYSSLRINRLRGVRENRWHEESFDRIIRDEEHLWRVIQYIGRNPCNAHLAADAYTLWVRPEWKRLGWSFEATLS